MEELNKNDLVVLSVLIAYIRACEKYEVDVDDYFIDTIKRYAADTKKLKEDQTRALERFKEFSNKSNQNEFEGDF